MIIREARPEDALSIARVHVETWRTSYRDIVPADYLAGLSVERRAESWEQLLRRPAPRTFAYVAEDGVADEGRPVVGFASGGPERAGDADFPGELYAVYILRRSQRRGLGHRLMSAAAARLQALGMPAMLLWVLAQNPACRFYEALGGQVLRSQLIKIGGATIEEVAYGWRDASVLLPTPPTEGRDG